tara:strand:- start:697 stop:921 length:225 start_codon:yes stop_codon:yes gene_type:complete
MIIAILIITCISVVMNFILLMEIGRNQESNYSSVYKHQHGMWDDITQIGRTVRAIDKKIEDSTIYKTELRFMDK